MSRWLKVLIPFASPSDGKPPGTTVLNFTLTKASQERRKDFLFRFLALFSFFNEEMSSGSEAAHTAASALRPPLFTSSAQLLVLFPLKGR